jgi:uncharacterized LabA/DUF88 family protein
MNRKFLKPKKRIVAFIDSQNLNLGTQRMGWKVDWKKFRIFLKEKYGVNEVYLFIGYLSENESMYEYLHDLGYKIVLKPTFSVTKEEATDKEPKNFVKGNVDTEIVLMAIKEIKNYSKAIIVSADGDFYSLIEYLISKNKLLYIMSPNWQYSTLLKDFKPYIIDLSQHKKELAYHSKK